jgi:4-hydroxyphenylpyruvate dioxygenase
MEDKAIGSDFGTAGHAANPLFVNTILLGGTTREKITAASLAGFGEIELWRQDVEQEMGGADAVRQRLKEFHLGLTDYQGTARLRWCAR